jgi:inosine-uridine nucleoside N-ribohydrolase
VIPVWIDCDTGVDDAAALLLAHQLKELEIVGISTVAGNVRLEKTCENTRKVCTLAGCNYPVYRGADRPLLRPYKDAALFHGADGLGGAAIMEAAYAAESLPAWDAIYRAAQAHPGELELVAVGPMTNIAIALLKYPTLSKLLKRVLIMGGAAVGGNCTPCAEFNIYTDPEAAQQLFRSGVPIVMCGLDVTLKAYITPQEIDALLSRGGEVAKFFAESTKNSLRLSLEHGLPGVCMHDSCPLLYLTHPQLFCGEEAGVFVETQAHLTLGKTVTDLYSDHQFAEKNALVLLDIDREKFLEVFTRAIAAYG